MIKDGELFELESRYCPICGNFIKKGSPSHTCLNKDLEKIEKERLKELENEDIEAERSYDDKLDEFDKFYNQDNYYDKDIEEE